MEQFFNLFFTGGRQFGARPPVDQRIGIDSRYFDPKWEHRNAYRTLSGLVGTGNASIESYYWGRGSQPAVVLSDLGKEFLRKLRNLSVNETARRFEIFTRRFANGDIRQLLFILGFGTSSETGYESN